MRQRVARSLFLSAVKYYRIISLAYSLLSISHTKDIVSGTFFYAFHKVLTLGGTVA